MKKLREFFKEEMKNRWLMIILAISFLIRIIGIDYALPFRISPDEVPSIYGALKMMELKTLIPVFHFEAFKNIAPYPPYISYLYLLPFSLWTGIKFLDFLFLGGGFHLDIFKNFLISDLSPFFMIARLFSVFFGVATVYLVYKISKNIFKSETQALFSAAFLGLSYLHVSFSHWGRQWVYATFFFALIFYVLSLFNSPSKKKYFLALLLAGIGMGINYQIGISFFFITLWFLFYDRLSLIGYLKQKWLYKALGLFIALSLFAIIIYPFPLYIFTGSLQHHQISSGQPWNLTGLLNIYKFYFTDMFGTEQIFLFFIILGLAFCFFKKRGFFISIVCFSFIYIACFYFIFGINEGRYLMMLYPLFAVSAGYGLYQFFEKSFLRLAGYILAFLSFSFMLVLAIKLDYLLFKNDTRVQAFEWIKNSLPRDSKIIVMVPYMRLPPNKESIDEQKNIDKKSIFEVDLAESNLGGKMLSQPRYHALNLYSVSNQDFLNNIGDYINKQEYTYLIFNQNFSASKGASALSNIGSEVKIFEGFPGEGNIGGDIQDVINDFGGGVMNILMLKNNGPTIIIKKVN